MTSSGTEGRRRIDTNLLRRFLLETFGLSDLTGLLIDYGVPVESILRRYGERNMEAFVQESVRYLQQTGQLTQFVRDLQRIQPRPDWDRVYRFEDRSAERENGDRLFNWRASDGPELVPPVDMDEFVYLWRGIQREQYGSFRSRRQYDADEHLEEFADNVDARRTAFWSMLAFRTLRDRYADIAANIPGFWQFAVGFLEPETEFNAFGVVALAMGEEGIDADIPREISVGWELNEISMPIVVRPVSVDENAAPTNHPSLGTAACWASSRVGTNARGPGILTAKHAAGTRIGARVKFSGSTGKVLDVAPEGIDAALVDSPEAFSTSAPLRTIKAVAPFIDVEFDGAVSGIHATKVTATTDQLGILNSPAFPVRVLLADHGKPGDSGALVRQVKQGRPEKAIGLYMAKYKDAASRLGGLAQHLHQVVEIMDLELYE